MTVTQRVMTRAGDPSSPTSQSLVHNMTGSSSRNESSAEPLQLVLGTGVDDDENNWFIHEYDNGTLIDNAPYVGLRKVDSLAHYLLVCVTVAGHL